MHWLTLFQDKKAQISMEFVLVVLLFSAILVPTSIIFLNYANTLNYETQSAGLFQLGNDIVDLSEIMMYLGPPSSISFTAQIPPGIENISIISNPFEHVNQLVISTNIGGERSEMVFSSNADIVGQFNQSDYTPGVKRIKLTAIQRSRWVVLINIMDLKCTIDADRDGYEASSCGGSDCDDTNDQINPGVIEPCAPHKDLNCDGKIRCMDMDCYSQENGPGRPCKNCWRNLHPSYCDE